ncbi:MAG: hypothetical protein IKT12_05950 [Thermoguttaceae bacterium]|nr:hypothetical protein [Thermoguttaceae bacterium]
MKDLESDRKLRMEVLEGRVLLAVIAGKVSSGPPTEATPTEIAPWLVNTADDPLEWDTTDDIISLREAVDSASAESTIMFDPRLAGETIVLSGMEIFISRGITIDASDIGGMTIDAAMKSGVLFISTGIYGTPVELIGLVITGGSTYAGGGIFSDADTLSLTNCTVSGNFAEYGGGLYNDSGTLFLTNCTVSENSAENSGGIVSYGESILTDCTVTGNSAEDGVGGIECIDKLSMSGCAVSGNIVNSGVGGIGCYDGLNLSDSTVSENFANSGVGGIMVYGKSILTDCTVSENFSEDSVGGMMCYGKSILTGCTVTGNSGKNAGGIECFDELDLTDCEVSKNSGSAGTGGIVSHGESILTGCTVSENTAGEYGGGFYNDVGTLSLTNCIVSGNSAYGGVFYNDSGTLTLTNCTISGNTAWEYGGGFYNDAGALSLANCTVSGNSAEYGGGFYNDSGTLSLVNCTISENTAWDSGGGFYNHGVSLFLASCTMSGNFAESGGGFYNDSGTLSLANCTVSGNTAEYGGGIYSSGSPGNTASYNTIIVGNTASGSGDDLYGPGSLYAYNTLSSYTGWTESENCLTYDSSLPLFTDAAGGDYSLAENSQVIDKGNNDYVTTETDLAGNPRIAGGIVDLGAYEYRSGGGQTDRLAAPTISTGSRGDYVSCGVNRHRIQWSAVANASGYELAYSADGNSWTTVSASGTSAVVTGLTYGAAMQYRVRALGAGSYTDSDWSAVKVFSVCPMDVNGDGDISGGDRSIVALMWLAEEGDEDYQNYADINGDGEISNADRPFIGSNWSKEAGDADLIYPRALRAADAAFADYASAEPDVDSELF